MDDIKNIVEKIKKEMKSDKEMLFRLKGFGEENNAMVNDFIREKYIKMLSRDSEINNMVIKSFIDNLIKEIN